MLRIVLATALAFFPMAALADTSSIFQVQGSFRDGESLSGTLTLDLTTGKFTADTLQQYYLGSLETTYFPPEGYQGFTADGRYMLDLSDYDVRYLPSQYYLHYDLYLTLPTLPSAGQTLQLCTVTKVCASNTNSSGSESYVVSGVRQYLAETALNAGQISPLASSAATPEPSSITLLGTGLLGLGAAFRRRVFR